MNKMTGLKVLIVCSGNPKSGSFSLEVDQAFIFEQAENIKLNSHCVIEYFLIQGKGIIGYLKNISLLRDHLKKNRYDIIHAHGGAAGFISSFQSFAPLITTYHGSDINKPFERLISAFAAVKSKKNIFVSQSLHNTAIIKRQAEIIPCGINMEQFFIIDKKTALAQLGLDPLKRYVLFPAGFDNPVKNYNLAREAVQKIDKLELLELKKRTRNEVNLLLNASDLLIMTSLSEGSPQLIKEAMACNCPVVSTDVGDVKEIIDGVEGCFISSNNPVEIAEKITKALTYNRTLSGREKIKYLDNNIISKKIIKIYSEVVDRR
jgi:teichuronic acid biosynthesis glycosyltransferase TuaC